MKLGELKLGAKYRSQGTTLAVFIVGILLAALGIAYQAATSSNARQPTVYNQIVFGILIAAVGLSVPLSTLSSSEGLKEMLFSRCMKLYLDLSPLGLFPRIESSARIANSGTTITLRKLNVCWWYEKQFFVQNSAIGLFRDNQCCSIRWVMHTFIDRTRRPREQAYPNFSPTRWLRIRPCCSFSNTSRFPKITCEILILETWGSSQMLSRIIVSQFPLIEDAPEGRLLDEHAEILDRTWSDNFSRTVDIELKNRRWRRHAACC